ncbi:MAG TPA: serine protease [Planctomycetota bacterium]|nr:serine protease [Planctomycetota bacterium]
MITGDRVAQLGNDAAIAFLRSLEDPRAIRAVEAARTAVVLFRVSAASKERPGRIENSGSGVLVNGGRSILIAGHVLEHFAELPDVQFSILMVDGRTRRGRVPAVRGGTDGAPAGDWGLVDLDDPPPTGCPSLSMRDAVEGATVVLLGYSGELGVSGRGVVSLADPIARDPMYPLTFVGRVTDVRFGLAELLAGSQPLGGSSGGAVVDLAGNLVGVMTNTFERSGTWRPLIRNEGDGRLENGKLDPHSRDRAGRREWFEFKGTPVGVFREFLERRWQRQSLLGR